MYGSQEISIGLEKCFGIKLSQNKNSNSNQNILLQNDNYSIIDRILREQFGDNTIALKMTLDSKQYRKYYDGTYSSMINDSVSKIKHEGFEGVDLINLAKNIYDGINNNLAKSIFQTYNQDLLNLFNSIENPKHDITDIIISEHLSRIESFKIFYEDLQEDISNIMNNPASRITYLNKIIDNKTSIYEEFDFLLTRIRMITIKTSNCYQYTPEKNELEYVLLKISFLIKLYMNNNIYEYVLTGDYTQSCSSKIISRCKKMEKNLLEALKSLKQKYNDIFSDFNLFISNSYSNGFFVKNCLKNFDDNQLLLDYSGLNNLDDNIRRNIEDVCIVIPKIKTRGDDK